MRRLLHVTAAVVLLALLPAEAKAGSAAGTARASARIIAPAKVAVSSASNWSASIRTVAGKRTIDTTLEFHSSRQRDYSVGVHLEKNDAPLGTSVVERATSLSGAAGMTSATRVRLAIPEDGASSGSSHVRIIMHNY